VIAIKKRISMEKWGTAININGVTFSPILHSKCWRKIKPCDIIDTISVINITDYNNALKTIKDIKTKYIGKTYSEWLKLKELSKKGGVS
jgi:hypothetical protein